MTREPISSDRMLDAIAKVHRLLSDNQRMRMALESIVTSYITDAVPEVRKIARMGLGQEPLGGESDG